MKIQEFNEFLAHFVAPMISVHDYPEEKTERQLSRDKKKDLVINNRSVGLYNKKRALTVTERVRKKEGQIEKRYYELKRKQTFDSAERDLVEHLVSVYSTVKSNIRQDDKSILNELGDYIVRTAIAHVVAPDCARQQNTIAFLLEYFSDWSTQTYEGERICSGVLVKCDTKMQKDRNISFLKIAEEEFAKVLSNGVDSWWVLDGNGKLMDFNCQDSDHKHPANADRSSKCSFYPITYRGLASASCDGAIGLTLNKKGEILVFCDGMLKFAKRRGKWIHFCHKAIINKMSDDKDVSPSLARSIYETCLDASFAHCGACIGVLFNLESFEGNDLIPESDILCKSTELKPLTAGFLIKNKRFNKVTRFIRKELACLDGAIVLTRNGQFYASGSILALKGFKRDNQGGRTAAARELGRHGLGIKVSEDGLITGFEAKWGSGGVFLGVQKIFEIG